jgi:mono/diheme cytochrome c family protein
MFPPALEPEPEPDPDSGCNGSGRGGGRSGSPAMAASFARHGDLKVAATVLAVILIAAVAGAEGDPARGQIVFALAGGCGCHTTDEGPVGAGGREIKTPFGVFYGTNITPDRETGIGDWSDVEIIAAIREGYVRDGGVEAPVMPYYLYAGMADRDVRDLVAYLRTLAPARRENRAAEARVPFPRLAYRAWRLLFAPQATAIAEAPTEPVARGRYLADHVAICTDCHTPRTRFGTLDSALYLAGTDDGPNGETVPNITPDVETGIGKWSENRIADLLHTGMKPNMHNVQGLMAEVVDGVGGGAGYAQAPEAELRWIAKYLKTVPPIRHKVGGD